MLVLLQMSEGVDADPAPEPTVNLGEFKAAGVLPFAFNAGSCWVLLGGELCRTGPGGKFLKLMCEYGSSDINCLVHCVVRMIGSC